jgi:hypothetical protein
LTVAAEEALTYAESIRAFDAVELDEHRKTIKEALNAAAQSQGASLKEESPEERFLNILFDGVDSGALFLHSTAAKFGPSQEIVGWEDTEKDELLLLPDASFAAVSKLAREQGRTVGLSPERLWRALDDRGLLSEHEPDRFTIRRQGLPGAKSPRARVVPLLLVAAREIGGSPQSPLVREETGPSGPGTGPDGPPSGPQVEAGRRVVTV